jgi:hypothetical protein
MRTKTLLTTLATTAALAADSADAASVWSVNVGNSTVASTNEITTTDNYFGVASENTANSTWNAVSNTDLTVLADSTGDSTAGVTFKITPDAGSVMDFGGQVVTGDEIFNTWIKDGDAGVDDAVNDDPFTVSFGNLSTTATYSLVVYSDWFWGTNSVPVELTAGAGLTGTFNINSPRLDANLVDVGVGGVGPLLEDTNAANSNDGLTNYARFDGLTADGLGNLSILTGGVDGPINGFQLVEFAPVTIPEPTSLLVGAIGLGGLALRRRRG